MTAVNLNGSVRFPYQSKFGNDQHFQPLRRCAREWRQLCTLDKDNHFSYKAVQVALRAIPAVVLALATFFAGVLCTIGSVFDSCCSTAKENWGGRYIDVVMDLPLIQRCIEMGIHNPDLSPVLIEGRLSEKVPNHFSSLSVAALRFDDNSRVHSITLSVSKLSFGDRTICQNLRRDLLSCFDNAPSPPERVYSVDGLAHYLLGLDVAPEKRAELEKVIKSANRIYVDISTDLSRFRIALT